ncbi:MAG: DUF3047 domain-containing protein [Planctomycetota bacterium]
MYHARHAKLLSPRFPLAGIVLSILLIAISNPVPAEEVTFGFESANANETTIPHAWKVLGNPRAGQPEFTVEKDDDQGMVLRLHAQGNESDGIYRSVNVDLAKTPFINFSWKVKTHPKGRIGTNRDDQAVQVQLNFGRHGFRRRVLSYGFDAKARVGQWYDDSSFVAVNRVLVLNSGKEKLGEWLSHSRNVVEDYRNSYRGNPPRLKNISIFCDSNDSHSESLSYCTEITFSEKPVFEASESE